MEVLNPNNACIFQIYSNPTLSCLKVSGYFTEFSGDAFGDSQRNEKAISLTLSCFLQPDPLWFDTLQGRLEIDACIVLLTFNPVVLAPAYRL